MAEESNNDYSVNFLTITDINSSSIYSKNPIALKIQNRSDVNQPQLLKKLTEMNKSRCLILFDFIVLITFNINFAHFCIHHINQQLGIIPSAVILLSIMAFSFAFQSSFLQFLIKSKTFNFGNLIEAHFGSLSAVIYEIVAVLWLGLGFLSTFVTCDQYLTSIIKADYYKYSISAGFLIILLILNACQFNCFIIGSIVFSFIIHFLNFGVFIYSLSLRPMLDVHKEPSRLINYGAKASNYFEAFSAMSSVMNSIIILFWVNIKLKKDFNYSESKSRMVLMINYGFNLIFYATYVLEGFFQYEKFDQNVQHYLLYVIEVIKSRKAPEALVGHLCISLNLAYEIFLTTFYFFVLKSMIFRTSTREFFIGKKYYLYFTPLLLTVLVLSLALNNPFRIIVINNSTFGFIVNFIFPSLILLKIKNTMGNIYILGTVFALFAVVLSAFYNRFIG